MGVNANSILQNIINVQVAMRLKVMANKWESVGLKASSWLLAIEAL